MLQCDVTARQSEIRIQRRRNLAVRLWGRAPRQPSSFNIDSRNGQFDLGHSAVSCTRYLDRGAYGHGGFHNANARSRHEISAFASNGF